MKIHIAAHWIICSAIGAGMILPGCGIRDSNNEEYVAEIESWREGRMERLTAPRGYLALAGLYRLREGHQSVGSADTCAVRFPAGAPINIGTYILDNSSLSFYPAGDLEITTEAGTFDGGSIDLTNSPILHIDPWYWTVIERGGHLYVRLWDTLHTARQAITHIPHFTVDPQWKTEVHFTAAAPGTVVLLDDMLGHKVEQKVEGTLSGTIHRQAFTLLALDGGAEQLFIIFDDATTDLETYPAGRYLYIPRPDEDGRTTLDFNKAYNPPCAYSAFTTCLLPPQENKLPFAVTAGEQFHVLK